MATYDVLLFGGANSSGYVFGDTWVFDTSTLMWQNLTTPLACRTPGNCPGPRHDAASVLDSADNVVVLFGGCSSVAPGWTEGIPSCGSGASILGDTWTWGGTSWTKVSTTPAPVARYGSALSDDLTDSGAVLFGGCGRSVCPLPDTWTFSAGSWTQCTGCVSPNAPSPRFGEALAWGREPTFGNKVVLFGGCGTSAAGCAVTGELQDTWVYLTGTWKLKLSATICLTTSCPAPRYDTAFGSYTVPGGYPELVVYGGVSVNGSVAGDLTEFGTLGWWIYPSGPTSNSWASSLTPPGFANWFTGSPPTPPEQRYDGAFVGVPSDPLVDETYPFLVGGSSPSGSSLGDTWFSTSVTATARILPPLSPGPSWGASMAYDAVDGYVVLFGGCGAACPSNGTWTYADGAWTARPLVTTVGPPIPGLVNASMTYTGSDGNSVIVYGGVEPNGTLNSDVWRWDPTAPQWKLVNVTGSRPAPRQSAAFTFDPSLGVSVLFGGCGTTCPLGDTWTFTLGTATWTPITTPTHPSARFGAGFVNDAYDGYDVLFGGCGTTCPLGDTWTYDSTGWSHCLTTGCTSGTGVPSARWGPSITYDGHLGEVVLHGGCGSTCPLANTYTFTGRAWAHVTPTISPPARVSAPMTFDYSTGDQYDLLFGGLGNLGIVRGEYGWAFSGTQWYTTSQPLGPPANRTISARFGASMAYNSTGNYVLLFGGCSPGPRGNCGPLTNWADTWEFQNGSWSRVCVNCGPSGRWDASLAFDTSSNLFILYGGCMAVSDLCRNVLMDTWEFLGHGWGPLNPTNVPPARGDASFVWDAADLQLILYGGMGCGTPPALCSDTWEFVPGSTWSLLSPSTAGLQGRYGAAIAYDPLIRQVVLYGGHTSGTFVFSDTWFFRTASLWVSTPYLGPAPVFDASMAYDPINSTIVLAGGALASGTPESLDSNTWQFNGTAWRPSGLYSYGFLTPGWGAATVFDPAAGPVGELLTYGGSLGIDGQPTPYAGGTAPGGGGLFEFMIDPDPDPNVVGQCYWYWLGGFA